MSTAQAGTEPHDSLMAAGPDGNAAPGVNQPLRPRARPWRVLLPIVAPLLMAAVAVGAMALLLVQRNAQEEQALIAGFQRHQLAIAQGLATTVEGVFRDLQQALLAIAQVDTVADRTPELQKILDGSYGVRSDILNGLSLLDVNGRMVARGPRLDEPYDASKWPEFQEVLRTRKPVVGDPSDSAVFAANKVVRILVPVERDGELRGVLNAAIGYDKLWATCLSRVQAGRTNFCWVVDSSGVILHDTDRSHLYRTYADIEADFLRIGSPLEEEEAAEAAVRARVRRGEEGVAEFRNNNLGGVDQLIAFAPIHVMNKRYGLAVVAPRSEITDCMASQLRLSFQIIAGLALLLGVAGYLAIRSVRAHWQLHHEQQVAAERQRGTEALRQSEERYRSVVDNISMGVALVNPQMEVLAANRQMRVWYPGVGNPGRQACYLTFNYPSQDTVCPDCPTYQTLQDGQVHEAVKSKVTLQGERDIRIISSPIRDASGTVVAAIEVLDDITERKRMDEAAAQSRQQLEAVNEQLRQVVQHAGLMAAEAESANIAKSEFLANMSHEIRTPLTAILGYADLLREDGGLPQQQGQYAEVIHRNGQHLLGLINDILDLSKIEAGQLLLDPRPCRVQAVVADVLSMMRVRAAEKRLSLEVRYHTAVPETLVIDEARLRQCLINLVSNAIKFTETGGVIVSVAWTTEGTPAIRFDVADTGIGIRPDTQKNLFQPFVQGDSSTSRKYGGTGLGLTITRRIVEKMGGQVTVRSVLGEGSTFSLCIPIEPMDSSGRWIDRPEEAVQAWAPESVDVAGRLSLQGARILLAEDGPDNRRLIGTLLRRAGAEVALAENGRVAVEMAGAVPYDIVLMDMQMPEMDGYQAAAQLRSQGLGLPIIALTAHALSGDRELCLRAGCTDYVSKPIDRQELMGTIGRYWSKPVDAPAVAASPGSDQVPPRVAQRSAYADDPDLAQVLQAFVARLPERIEQMREAARHGCLEDLQRLAHQLKGAGGGYGYSLLSDAARELEEAAKRKDLEACALVIEQLAQMCRAIQAGHGAKPVPQTPSVS